MAQLNEPVKIHNLELKNRLVMPPMATAKSQENGKIQQALVEYYDQKSKDGYLGLVITEHAFVAPEGKAGNGQISISSDEDIPGLKKVTDALHANNTPVFAQINHAGMRSSRAVTGMEIVGPSAVCDPRKVDGETARELSKAEIQEIVSKFASAAVRAKAAGYDGVEIHSAHGYLLNQFYSPLTNHRTDEYGGSLENRIRIHLEIIDAVRRAVGEDYPIALRLGAMDDLEGSPSIEEAVKAVKAFEKAGIDLIDITGGISGYIRKGHSEPGWFAPASKAVKEAVHIPVMVTGGIRKIEDAQLLLDEDAADLIGVGRGIMVDDAYWRQAVKDLDGAPVTPAQ